MYTFQGQTLFKELHLFEACFLLTSWQIKGTSQFDNLFPFPPLSQNFKSSTFKIYLKIDPLILFSLLFLFMFHKVFLWYLSNTEIYATEASGLTS